MIRYTASSNFGARLIRRLKDLLDRIVCPSCPRERDLIPLRVPTATPRPNIRRRYL